jgi:DNA-binding GntR family transcriptional regulator
VSVIQWGIAAPARTTQSWVADELRARIIVGTIPVGSRLRQVDVATEFKVSTTPVREAFRTLATEGLVQIDERRGVVVRRLSLEECIELQELIIVVESDNLMHSIPMMDDQTLSEAESTYRKMLRGGKQYPLLNRELHLTLARPSGRRRSIALLAEMLTLSALHVREDTRRIDGRREQWRPAPATPRAPPKSCASTASRSCRCSSATSRRRRRRRARRAPSPHADAGPRPEKARVAAVIPPSFGITMRLIPNEGVVLPPATRAPARGPTSRRDRAPGGAPSALLHLSLTRF